MHDLPPFPGFRDEAFDFLRALKANNRRDWFKPRKATYDDEVLWPLRCLVADAARRAHEAGLPLTGDPKKSIFRLYRDTRFSKNKDPYKTHAGAVLSRSGSSKESGIVYLHIEPGASFLAAGFWQPENDLLRRWRTRLVEAPTAFLDVVARLNAAGLAPDNHDHALKRLPRGFDAHADSEIADYLRWKTFIVSRPVDDDALRTPAFTDAVVAMMHDAAPLLDFGWQLTEPAAV